MRISFSRGAWSQGRKINLPSARSFARKRESWTTSIFSALAATSDIGPHIEASDGGQYAELFETQNESELAEKMIALLTDEQRREVLATKAREFANETFSIDAHLKRLISLYASLFAEGAHR